MKNGLSTNTINPRGSGELIAAAEKKAAFSRFVSSDTVLLLGILAAVLVLGAIWTPQMYSWGNFYNILRTASYAGIVALSASLVLLVGEFDLSTGSIISLSSMTASLLLGKVTNSWIPIVVTLAVGMICGIFNGILVVKLKIPALFATLGTMQFYSGLAMLITSNVSVFVYEYGIYRVLGKGAIFGLPIPAIIFVVLALVLHLILTKTKFGKEYYYTGTNSRAAYLSGINVNQKKIIAYALAGMIASISGIAISGQVNMIASIMGNGYELSGIAIAILGGVRMGGGRGTVLGTLIGAITFQIMLNMLTLSGLGTYAEQVLKGALLIIIVIVYYVVDKNKAKRQAMRA
ncbi:MAG: ABC transporter permease [Anaerolineaceae bacterium]